MSRQGIAFDYSSPAELFLSRRRGRTPITGVSRQRLRPSAMLSKICAHAGPSAPGCRLETSGSTMTKSIGCMKSDYPLRTSLSD